MGLLEEARARTNRVVAGGLDTHLALSDYKAHRLASLSIIRLHALFIVTQHLIRRIRTLLAYVDQAGARWANLQIEGTV